MKWLYGDIKPQNMLLQMPADHSAIDHSDAGIMLAYMLADFGPAKVMDQRNSSACFMLSKAWSKAPCGTCRPRLYRVRVVHTSARILYHM